MGRSADDSDCFGLAAGLSARRMADAAMRFFRVIPRALAWSICKTSGFVVQYVYEGE
jgi:hypothetical protein